MELSSELLCLFSDTISPDDDGHYVEIPRREVDSGTVEPGDSYRVALVAPEAGEERETVDRPPGEPQPPVEPGEIRYVEIADLGKQGDGIARVERGYVIIVPGSDVGERVKIEVSEVKSNFAVGEIIDDA